MISTIMADNGRGSRRERGASMIGLGFMSSLPENSAILSRRPHASSRACRLCPWSVGEMDRRKETDSQNQSLTLPPIPTD